MTRLLLLSAFVLVGASAAAQPQIASGAGPGAWASVRVPGGVPALLKAAGLDESLPRARALRDVIHVIYDTQAGADESLDARRRRFVEYMESISAVEALRLDRAQPPITLKQADDRAVRRRLETVAEAIGCSLEREARVYRLSADRGERQARRRADLASAGLDVDAVITSANAGQALTFALQSDEAPLPLSPEAWTPLVRVSEKLSGSLVTAILGDRSTALLYFGLLGADATTRAFYAQDPALLRAIVESDRVAVFAGCGESIRVAEGRVVVPGGAAAVPLWQDLVGEPPARPDRFIPRLLEKDGGRLASLYDTARALDGPRRTFALGSWIPNPDARVDRFRSLYEAYSRLLAIWDPVARPLVRLLYDGSHVLTLTAVDSSGQAVGPTPVRLWRRAFDGIEVPADPAGDLGNADSEGHVDAAWLLQAMADVGQSLAARRSRLEMWLFAQRVFSHADRASLADVFVTLRGFWRFRLMLWTLERMGIRDPALYAAAVRQADRLSRIGNRDRAAVAHALFQGSLAIVERARTARTLDVPSAEALLRSLVAVPMSEDGEFLGGVARWMTAGLLPALAERLPPRGDGSEPTVEDTVLLAMAGRVLSLADSPNLGLWLEGLPYHVDLAAAEMARLRAVREKQRGVPLEVGLDLWRAASALAAPGVTLARLPQAASDLDRAARAVLALAGPGMAWLDQGSYRKEVASAADDLRKLKKPNDFRKLGRIALPFLQVADRLQSQATLSLVYATVLRDLQSTVLLDGDPAPRHDWLLGTPEDGLRPSPPWREFEADRTGGWHLKGSVLGADLALASESLRRVSVDRFPSPPTLSDLEAQAIAEGVSLIVAFDHSDADREALVGDVSRGRRRLEAVWREPNRWAEVADAMQISDFRRELLPWAIAHEPSSVPAFISMGELAMLGRLPGDSGALPDAWGTSGRFYDGRWGTRFPVAPAFRLLSGRKGGALIVSLVPDLVLSVAEVMHDKQVPAALTRAVLECAARDVLDEVQLQYFDDWVTLIGHTRVVPDRLDEYLASLTAGGPLVPVAR